jgi:hypothetical protein
MDLICEDCQTAIQIPDERVPPNSTFRLTCPRCKRKIVASTKTAEGQRERNSNVSFTPNPSELLSAVHANLDEGLPEATDCLQSGQSAALLCVNREEFYGELKAMLETMGYMVNIPATADHALRCLRFNQYHVILLADDFEGRYPNPIAEYLAGLNMNIRREMFVVLIGSRLKTGDHLQAFMESVDFVLHPGDLPQFVTLLTRGLKDHERFYKVFNECLTEVGKKL